jgi:hypothetical protein
VGVDFVLLDPWLANSPPRRKTRIPFDWRANEKRRLAETKMLYPPINYFGTLRSNYAAGQLRGLERPTKDAAQARRWLAIAAMLDGASRAERVKSWALTHS